MGYNNLIDSSNFINKILEIFELSYIYNIPLNKIDFYVSKEAYIHSIVRFKDSSITLNGFNNNMLIPLAYPLSLFYPTKTIDNSYKYLNTSNIKLESPNDHRFIFFKYYKKIKLLNHKEQINLMLLNNHAHKLYLSNKLKYNKIINFIMSNVSTGANNIPLNSFAEIEKYIVKFNNNLKSK
jgi:1-deoxy-D-xylulose-5-phosphate reductoisomerase